MIKLIVATDNNGVIGVGNELPWHLPKEMAHFKCETMSDNVIMGRNTWESIPNKFKPLVGRHNIVLTSSDKDVLGADDVINTVDSAIEKYHSLTVIGGASVYEQFLNRDVVDKVVLSVVDCEVEKSTINVKLTGFNPRKFNLISSDKKKGFTVLTYVKL